MASYSPGAGSVGAQVVAPADASPARAARSGEPGGTPRAALGRFLVLARDGQFADAGRFLDTSDVSGVSAATLARQFKAVLDRHLWVDLELVSADIAGDTADGLPAGVDEIGVIPMADGSRRPVRLVRQSSTDPEFGWRLSRGTVQRIPEWYGELGERWLLESIPASLQRPGPFDLLRWQWLAIIPLLIIAALLGRVSSRLVRAIAAHAVTRTKTTWDDVILARIEGPLTAALTLVAAALLVPYLSLVQPAADAAFRLVRVGLYGALFAMCWRVVDIARDLVAAAPWARASSSSRALLPLAGRVVKVLLAAVGAIVLLSALGFPVASLVAGLGLGGLALALAAQKTVENLFGSFSLGVDQPFREGDFVKVEDFVGTVETLGLRSTRFRTLDRTLITIPNGRLAEMRVESYAARDRLRLAATFGLVYETTAAQMRTVLAGIERVLRGHPKIWPDAVVVRFREFAASSLDIEVMAWFRTAEWSEFQLIRQEVLLQVMEVVEQAGTSFAFPTQTVHLAPDAPPTGVPRPTAPTEGQP